MHYQGDDQLPAMNLNLSWCQQRQTKHKHINHPDVVLDTNRVAMKKWKQDCHVS